MVNKCKYIIRFIQGNHIYKFHFCKKTTFIQAEITPYIVCRVGVEYALTNTNTKTSFYQIQIQIFCKSFIQIQMQIHITRINKKYLESNTHIQNNTFFVSNTKAIPSTKSRFCWAILTKCFNLASINSYATQSVDLHFKVWAYLHFFNLRISLVYKWEIAFGNIFQYTNQIQIFNFISDQIQLQMIQSRI